MKITNENDFYLSLLPIFRLSSLLKTFSASTWLGRSVYLMTYLFGAFPYFVDLMAIAHRLLSGTAPIRDKKIHSKAFRAPLQKDMKTDDSLGSKSRQPRSIGRDSQFEVKEEPHVDRCKDDFAFARLLQEEEDAEEARKLMQEYAKRTNKFDRPYARDHLDMPDAMHDDDFAFAQKLQAELYEQEDLVTPKDALSLQDNFLLPKTKALTPRDPLTPKELERNKR